MSLGGALQIGRSGLLANQAAIEVTGHNLANVGTRGYHRQTIALEPTKDQQIQQGVFIGRGVQVQQILRQIDEALEGRLRGGIADQSGAATRRDVLSQIEALQNELSDIDLSSRMGEFFNAWSELANSPLDNSVRTVVIQQGSTVASFMRELRAGLTELRAQVDADIDASAVAVDDLLSRVQQLNRQIANTEGGSGGAHGLRDQRDLLLGELSQYMDISTVEQPSGAVDVFVGSIPLVLDGRSRGVEVRRRSVDGEVRIEVVLKDDKSVLEPEAGRLGALIKARRDDVNTAVDTLDRYANELIYQVNWVHSQGQGAATYNTVTGTSKMADTAAAFHDAGMKFQVYHGSFEVHVTQKSTGMRVTTTVNIDCDGINPAGDTTLASLAAQLDGITNLDASITADGRLRVAGAGNDFTLGFSDDSSGILSALGINTFFTGSSAADIGVNAEVQATPGRLATGQEYVPGDNRNALAMAALKGKPMDALGGLSLEQSWGRHVEDYAVRLGQTTQQLEADSLVRENLEAQQQAVSGVNSDEEAINLLSYQRAYQGSARFLTVVDEMLQTLLGLV